MYYSKEQKEKDETLIKLHKDFAPLLKVLLRTTLQTLPKLDDTVSADTLLSECQVFIRFFLANMPCSLAERSSRRPQVYRSHIPPALASLLRLNPRRLWLLPRGTISSAHTSMQDGLALLSAVVEAMVGTTVEVAGEASPTDPALGSSVRPSIDLFGTTVAASTTTTTTAGRWASCILGDYQRQ